jgi:hypothetical protein
MDAPGTPRYGHRVGTWGPGAFGSDDALDLLDTLTEQDAAGRRETLGQIFRAAREHPDDLNWTLAPGRVVAAAAVVAAGGRWPSGLLMVPTGHFVRSLDCLAKGHRNGYRRSGGAGG